MRPKLREVKLQKEDTEKGGTCGVRSTEERIGVSFFMARKTWKGERES